MSGLTHRFRFTGPAPPGAALESEAEAAYIGIVGPRSHSSRSIVAALGKGSQRLAQRAKPAFIGLRHRHAFTIERLAYLFAAGCSYGVCGQVEFDAIGLVVQPKEAADAAGRRFLIIDNVLIAHGQNAAGCSCFDGVHQPNIIAIKAGDMFKIVCRRMPFRKQKLEIRPAAIERVPSHVNDFGFRQDEPDEAKVHPVQMELVSEELRVRSSKFGCPVEIALTKVEQFIS